MSYSEFLARKKSVADKPGRVVGLGDIHPSLHSWQKELVVWSVETSRAAIWADTGLGKTRMQIEWARLSGETVLIVAPLAVCRQTVREAAKIGGRDLACWCPESELCHADLLLALANGGRR